MLRLLVCGVGILAFSVVLLFGVIVLIYARSEINVELRLRDWASGNPKARNRIKEIVDAVADQRCDEPEGKLKKRLPPPKPLEPEPLDFENVTSDPPARSEQKIAR